MINHNKVKIDMENDKSRIMMLSLIVTFIVTCFVSMSFIKAKKIDFSGAWEIDVQSSDFGLLQLEIAAPKSITVAQQSKKITVVRYFVERLPMQETLEIGGEFIESIVSKNTKKKGYVNWAEGGKVLIFSSHYIVDDKEKFEYDRTEKWRLSERGKRLVVERITQLPDRTDSVRAIYDKVKVK